MRKVNIDLNLAKLATKRIQLDQISKQVETVQAKLVEVQKRLAVKQLEVSELETLINTATTETVVNN